MFSDAVYSPRKVRWLVDVPIRSCFQHEKVRLPFDQFRFMFYEARFMYLRS